MREIELRVHNFSSGIDATVMRDGLLIGGWYDSMVGIEGRLISWAEIDEARVFIQSRRPMREWQYPASDEIPPFIPTDLERLPKARIYQRKYAYVIDSGRAEALICRNCVFIAHLKLITRPYLEECTPVTLSCEAKCSKCGEGI